MSQIVDRTRVGDREGTDYALAMTSLDIGRKLQIGSNWKRLRIGLRYAISQSANADVVTLIANPKFAVGMSAGTGSLYSSTNGHFVGMDYEYTDRVIAHNIFTGISNYFSSGDGSNVAAARRYVVVYQNSFQFASTVGITDYFSIYQTSGSPSRFYMYVELIKQTSGSTDAIVDPGLWTLRYYQWNDEAITDNSASVMFAQLGNDTASVAGMIFQDQLVPVSESLHGALDTVNIMWSKQNPPLEISDIGVWRFR